MVVNSDKTQIVHFRKRQMPRTEFDFKLGNITLTKVSRYCYLGCTVNEFFGKSTIDDVLAEGATRALGKYYTNKGLGYETYTKLYNACISPIMNYCSGIWGRQNNDNILKVHNRAIQCFLGVNKYAPIAGFQGDMGWTWPQVRHKIVMLRYWNRILQLEQGRLPKQLFDFMKELNYGLMNDMKDIFKQINCTDLFENNMHIVNFKHFSIHAQETLMSHHIMRWKNVLLTKSKLQIYREYKYIFSVENYCKINLDRHQRSIIAKLRLGILSIQVETGHYSNTPREERYCPLSKVKQ